MKELREILIALKEQECKNGSVCDIEIRSINKDLNLVKIVARCFVADVLMDNSIIEINIHRFGSVYENVELDVELKVKTIKDIEKILKEEFSLMYSFIYKKYKPTKTITSYYIFSSQPMIYKEFKTLEELHDNIKLIDADGYGAIGINYYDHLKRKDGAVDVIIKNRDNDRALWSKDYISTNKGLYPNIKYIKNTLSDTYNKAKHYLTVEKLGF